MRRAPIVAGGGKHKSCANAKQEGAAVCMPGLSRARAEALILDDLRDALMIETAVAQFREDYARHLAEQNKDADERTARRNTNPVTLSRSGRVSTRRSGQDMNRAEFAGGSNS